MMNSTSSGAISPISSPSSGWVGIGGGASVVGVGIWLIGCHALGSCELGRLQSGDFPGLLSNGLARQVTTLLLRELRPDLLGDVVPARPTLTRCGLASYLRHGTARQPRERP